MKAVWKTVIILLLLSALPAGTVSADYLLPSDLTEIGASAFEGNIAVDSIVIPDNVESIGSRAFAKTELYHITIPPSVTSISTDAFEDITTPLLITADPRTAAVLFALKNDLDFRADTVCRALLIGQSEYPSGHKLSGPAIDMETMSDLLSADYDITVRENLSPDEILNAVTECFGDATNEDISLFYYSGHGFQSSDPNMNGALIGIDYASYVTASELRNALDSIPGRKIVLVDACYSGGLIEESTDEANGAGTAGKKKTTAEDPAAAIIRAFSVPRRMFRASLAAQQYFVMASSKSNEMSWERNGGVFTNCFAQSRSNADTNADAVISFREAFEYTARQVQTVVASGGLIQTVQTYPDDCFWFGMFR